MTRAAYVVPPEPTARLTFCEMDEADLDLVERLLGDPVVMAHYPRVKTREECAEWIAWHRRGYAADGFGLWLLHEDGVFVGECGLTWQSPDGQRDLELGYHLLPEAQGRGLATEAALACRAHAEARGVRRLIAVVAPGNAPSRRVAERAGLAWERRTTMHARTVDVLAADLG